MNERLSNQLNLLRWFAAFLVVVGHARGLLFVEYALLENKTPFAWALYFVTGFGHQAVIIFFVLSGFLVGGKVIERVLENNFDLKKYALDRLTRLYVVVFFALVFGSLIDLLGISFLSRTGLYARMPSNFAGQSPESQISIPVFIGNLLFLQTILVPTLGSNGPLWSLANEFWYYVICPFLVMLFSRTVGISKKVIFGLFLAFVAWLLPLEILAAFPIWLIGAFTYLLKIPIIKYRYATLALLLLVLLLIRAGVLSGFASDYILSIAFALFLNSLSLGDSGYSLFPRLNKFMANFSFSLYAIHFPILVFTVSLFLPDKYSPITHLDASSFGLYVGLIFLIYCIAFVFSLLTEQNTTKIRQSIDCVLNFPPR